MSLWDTAGSSLASCHFPTSSLVHGWKPAASLAKAEDLEPPSSWEQPQSQKTPWGGCQGLEMGVIKFGCG